MTLVIDSPANDFEEVSFQKNVLDLICLGNGCAFRIQCKWLLGSSPHIPRLVGRAVMHGLASPQMISGGAEGDDSKAESLLFGLDVQSMKIKTKMMFS